MYPLVFHRNLALEKWFSYPVYQQILMIANEMNRSQNALENNDLENAVHAWERAFELTDLVTADVKNAGMLKELLRFREMLGEVFISCDPAANRVLMTELIRLNPVSYNSLQ